MKVHQIVLTVIDFDGLGAGQVCATLQESNYPNDCIRPRVRTIQTREIGEWDESNPLNYGSTREAELERLFGAA